MKKNLLIASISLCMASCAHNSLKEGQDYVVIEEALRTPPVDAMDKCPELTALKDKSFASTIEKLSEAIDLLEICSARHEALKTYIKDGQDADKR